MSKEDKGKVKMTVIHFETESENATLQANINAIAQTLSKALSQPARVIYQPAQLPTNGSPTNGEHVETEDDAIEAEFTPIEPKSNGSSKPKSPRRPPKTPDILKEFDPNDGDVGLFDYVKGKNVSTQNNKYIVIAAYFKRHRDVHEISTSHIYTCFQLLKWPSPDDVGKPFRNMKDNNNYFDNGSQQGLWEITIIGLNEVDRLSNLASDE